MFRGINAINIDGKRRLAIPTRYRAVIGSSLVVTIDTEETCLLLYQTAQWQLIEDQLQRLPSFNPAARRIQRLLIGHATDVDVDAQGRVLLSPELCSYAAIDKRAVMIGQGNKFEVWSESLWEEKRGQWLAEEATKVDALPDELKTFYL